MKMRNEIGAIVLLTFFSALIGCTAKKAQNFNFIDGFSEGSISPNEVNGSPTGKPAFVMNGFLVGGENRRALVVMASGKIVFDIGEVGNQTKLKFSVGMNATMGDGAEGVITVEAAGTSEVVYRRFLNPIDRPDDRKWFDEAVDLSKFTGKGVKISFETKPGPKGDATGDWFAWANLQLIA
jgi:hypothetical protein